MRVKCVCNETGRIKVAHSEVKSAFRSVIDTIKHNERKKTGTKEMLGIYGPRQCDEHQCPHYFTGNHPKNMDGEWRSLLNMADSEVVELWREYDALMSTK